MLPSVDEHHGEVVLEERDVHRLVGGAVQRDRLEPGPDRRLGVAGLEARLRQDVEVDRASPEVEPVDPAARLLQVLPPELRRSVRRLDAREGDPDPHLEVGILGSREIALEEVEQEPPRLVGIVEVHVDPRLPVLGADTISRPAALCEELGRLGERGTGPDDVAHPRVGLAGPEQELATDDAIGGCVGEVGVGLGRLGVAARGEVEVRVHARPATRVIGEQRVRRRAQPGRQVVQRRHRGLRMPQLERADVCLGVAVAGQLLLGQVGRQPRGTDPGADGLGQLALVDDDPTPGLELGIGHRRIIRRVKSWSTADPRCGGTRRAGRRAGRSSGAGRGATGSSVRARPPRRSPS